ncbi:MAG: hypothetical protein WDW36_004200 [Sanguina aurantia]
MTAVADGHTAASLKVDALVEVTTGPRAPMNASAPAACGAVDDTGEGRGFKTGSGCQFAGGGGGRGSGTTHRNCDRQSRPACDTGFEGRRGDTRLSL